MDQLPDDTARLLEEIDQAGHPLPDHEVADRIRTGRGSQPDGEANEAVPAEVIAFSFAVNHNRGLESDREYFRPLMSATREDGSEFKFPDRDDIPAGFIQYWENRSREAQHPVLRARYADLVWDLARASPGLPPDAAIARSAIDVYLDAAERRLIPQALDLELKIARALGLALATGDRVRVARAKTIALSCDETGCDGEAGGTRGLAYDILLPKRDKVWLSEVEETVVIARQEALLAEAVHASATAGAEKPAGDADPCFIQTVALRLASYYRSRNRPDDVRRVLGVYQTTVLRLGRSASGLVASVRLERPDQTLRSFGLSSEAETVRVALRRIGKTTGDEMKAISHRMEIEHEHLKAIADEVLQGPPTEQVARIAAHFLPRAQDLKTQVEDLASRFPLQYLVPQMILDGDGRAVAHIGIVDQDLEGRMVVQLAQNLVLQSPFLHYVLGAFCERVGTEEILSALLESPLFDQEAIVRTGLAAYAKEDHITCLHGLLPQVERALRRMLELCQVSIYRPGPHGGFVLKSRSSILDEPAVETAFGRDFVFYGRAVLTDQRGWNVRHDLAHGAMGSDRMTGVVSDRVVHIL